MGGSAARPHRGEEDARSMTAEPQGLGFAELEELARAMRQLAEATQHAVQVITHLQIVVDPALAFSAWPIEGEIVVLGAKSGSPGSDESR